MKRESGAFSLRLDLRCGAQSSICINYTGICEDDAKIKIETEANGDNSNNSSSKHFHNHRRHIEWTQTTAAAILNIMINSRRESCSASNKIKCIKCYENSSWQHESAHIAMIDVLAMRSPNGYNDAKVAIFVLHSLLLFPLFLFSSKCSSYFAESTKTDVTEAFLVADSSEKSMALYHIVSRAHSMPVNINKRRWPTADSPIKSIYIYIGVTGINSVSSRMSRRYVLTCQLVTHRLDAIK